jgi:hypothetical protein
VSLLRDVGLGGANSCPRLLLAANSSSPISAEFTLIRCIWSIFSFTKAGAKILELSDALPTIFRTEPEGVFALFRKLSEVEGSN